MEVIICQSCAMPFDEAHEKYIAKEKDGSNSVYCTYCYDNGAFIDPGATISDMVEMALPHLTRKIGNEDAAKKILTESISGLMRWR